MFTRSIALNGFVSSIQPIAVATDGFIYILILPSQGIVFVPQKNIYSGITVQSKSFAADVIKYKPLIEQILRDKQLMAKIQLGNTLNIQVGKVEERIIILEINSRFIEEYIKSYAVANESKLQL